MTKTPEQNQKPKKSSWSALFVEAGNVIISTLRTVNPLAVTGASEGRRSGEQIRTPAEKL